MSFSRRSFDRHARPPSFRRRLRRWRRCGPPSPGRLHLAPDAPSRYATAHAAHYTIKDLRGALELYQAVIASHPDSAEAGYSRTQIQNIVSAVVPKTDAFANAVAMAVTHLDEGMFCTACTKQLRTAR